MEERNDNQPSAGDAPKARRVIAGRRNPAGVVAALLAASGMDPAAVMRPLVQAERQKRRGSNLPAGAQWVHHEKPGSRAAQRRLRQAAQGVHRLEQRCSVCGEWTSASLGGFTDPKTGKFACHGCAVVHVEELAR